MNDTFEQESRRWDDEVKRVAADLVRTGTPPFQAIEDAREIVKQRRREAARKAREES